jgi:hypothetical protein
MADHPTFADKSALHRFFGPNRNTHWIIAGSVMVIVLGGYLAYSFDANRPTVVLTVPATAQAPAPSAPQLPVPASEK